MIIRTLYYVTVFFLAVLWGATAKAQDNPSLFATETEASQTTEATWSDVATAAESSLSGPTPSLFRLNRMRAELVGWRDTFLDAEQINAGRIETVNAQIAALGDVPEGTEEPATVSVRRTELETQLATLQAPALLAQESYARANGLIG